MRVIKQPLTGRMAREAARIRSHRVLSGLVDGLIEQHIPWFEGGASVAPEQGHEAFCALQRHLVQEARSKAEAALLNDLLHDRIDRRNIANPGHEIAAPGAITAVLSIRSDQAFFLTQIRSALTSAFAVSISFLITATMATFAGFPAARSASYFALRSGLKRMATRAGM